MEKIPNLIKADNSELKDVELEKRGKILEYVKEKRSERDSLLKESSSFKTKIKDALGYRHSESLKEKSRMIQNQLHEDVSWQHELLERELKKESQSIIEQTIKLPLKEMVRIYYQKAQAKQNEDSTYQELFKKEKEVALNFRAENIIVGFENKEIRKDLTYDLNRFFEENIIYENLLDDFGYTNTLDENTKGFPVEIAKTVLDGVFSMIEKNDISSVEDDPALFRLIEKSLNLYRRKLNDEQKKILSDLMSQKGVYLDTHRFSNCTKLIELAASNSPEFTEKLGSRIEDLFPSKKWSEINDACESRSKTLSDIALSKLDTYLQKYDLKLDNFQKAWELYPGSGQSSFRNLETNMEKIEMLESERPGITNSLFNEFGIKEFRRYPNEVLIEQFDSRNKDIPYGLVLFTNQDHNQSFDMRSGVIDSVFKQTISNGLGMRIAEFDSRYDLFKKLISLDSRYGTRNKIQYIFLGAHGTEDVFQTTYTESVSKEDFEGKGVKKVKNFFAENPEIIMASCSTGVEGGIAQKISETYEAVVHAPTKPTNVKDITVSFEDKIPHFKVVYADDVLNTFASGYIK